MIIKETIPVITAAKKTAVAIISGSEMDTAEFLFFKILTMIFAAIKKETVNTVILIILKRSMFIDV